MVAPRKYPDEVCERAVRMVLDAKQDPVTGTGAGKRIGQQLGINSETLRGWVTQSEIDTGGRPGTTTVDAAPVAELEREVRELRRANAILRSASAFFRRGARPPLALIVDYVDAHKDLFGVEPIVAALRRAGVPIAPSTYYAARRRPASARARRDERVKTEISRVYGENYGVYGVRKVHAQLAREQVVVGGRSVARCTVARLMRALGLRGVSRARGLRTTVLALGPDTRPDLVERDFTAAAPDRLWVADITDVPTFAGWVYAAFVLDVFSRRVVGWQVSTPLRTDLALDALEMGLWTRARDGYDTTALVRHSDRGVQGGLNRSSQHLS